MLRLKSFTEDQDRPMVPLAVPTVSLSLRLRVCHPKTRTYVRLLGPCFKTGRWRGFRPRDSQTRRARGGITCKHATSPSAVCRTRKPREPRTPHRIRTRGCAKDATTGHSSQPLPFQRFQALFNSLFKVLCIFPSRYLFAIGLTVLFSFRRNLPPA